MKKAPQKTVSLSTYVRVEVDADFDLEDVLEEISSTDMIAELQRRGALPTSAQKATVMDALVMDVLSEAAKRFTLAELQERLR